MNKEETSAIKLSDVIDINTLQKFQDTFSASTGIASLIVDKEGPVTKPSNFTDFCVMTRRCKEGFKSCNECDFSAGKVSAEINTPYIYNCHAGLRDFAAPIIVNGKQIGAIMGGQVLSEPPDEEKIREKARTLGINEEKYVEAIRKIKIVPEENIKNAAQLLYIISNSLSEIGYKNFVMTKSKEKINSILSGMIDGVFAVNEFGIIEYGNNAIFELYGGTESDLIGKNLNLLLPDFCFNDTFVSKNYTNKYTNSQNDLVLKTKNGQDIAVGIKTSEISLDNNKLFLFVVRDITLRKKHELELLNRQEMIVKSNEREVLLRKLTEAIRSTLDMRDIARKAITGVAELLNADRCFIIEFNQQSNKFLPIKETYSSSEKILDIKGLDINVEVPEIANKARLGEEVIVIDNEEYIFNNKLQNTLTERHLINYNIKSGFSVPIYYTDQLLGIFTIHYTKQKYAFSYDEVQLIRAVASQTAIAMKQGELYATAQESTKIKSEFIANMSHEIRTPLNAIIGFSQILKNCDYPKEAQQKYLNNIYLSATHLLNLINSILDFSKIDLGKMEIYYEKFSSNHLIAEIIASIQSMAIQKNITIETELSEVAIEADLVKFKQILLNLIINAIKFTKEGGNVTVRTKLSDNKLIVEVVDTGIGIDEKDRDKIFKFFRQIDSSYSRKQEGTGLGLALAKELVELHKGEIGFNSQKDVGSIFWFSVPVSKALSS